MFDEVEDITRKALEPAVYDNGLDEDCLKRLQFRLEWIEKAAENRKAILKNGNLAALEPEVFATLYLIQDLLDVVREAVTLIRVNFRKEQGVAPPLNEAATSSETQGLP